MVSKKRAGHRAVAETERRATTAGYGTGAHQCPTLHSPSSCRHGLQLSKLEWISGSTRGCADLHNAESKNSAGPGVGEAKAAQLKAPLNWGSVPSLVR